MPTSSSYLCPFVFIGYNSFHFWTLWGMIGWLNRGLFLLFPLRLMVGMSINYQVLRIVEYIAINYNTWFDGWVIISVSNGSGLSLRVKVRVQTEPLPNWWSGMWINPNRQIGYRSMVNFQPVRIAQVVSGLPSRSIYRFIWRLLFLQLVNSILSKSHFQQPIIGCWVFCSVQYQLIWNLCCAFDM